MKKEEVEICKNCKRRITNEESKDAHDKGNCLIPFDADEYRGAKKWKN